MTDLAKNTAKKQRGRPFKSGVSGNPSGRPRGARNKTTLAVQALLEEEATAISKKAIMIAKEGDMAAIRLVLERVLPPRKDTPITLDLPVIETAEDTLTALSCMIDAVAKGEITPSEGHALSTLINTLRNAIETVELEKRVSTLEKRQQKMIAARNTRHNRRLHHAHTQNTS